MFLRFLFLALVVALVIRAIRQRLNRRSEREQIRRQSSRNLGVDPGSIRDAEFTDVGGKEEAPK